MTSQQIKCFLHLSENLNFARTAEELYLSQPSVTREIQSLEAEMGVVLFQRSKKKVSLTPAGLSFQKDISPLYKRLNIAIAKARTCQENYNDRLDIGYCHAASVQFLPEALKKFHEIHPAVYLCPVAGELRNLNASFLAGDLDIVFGMKSALTPSPQDGFELLYKGYLCAFVPKGHPLYQKDSLNPHDINGHAIINSDSTTYPPAVANFVSKILQQCPNSPLAAVPNAEETQMLLRAGLGISIAPHYSISLEPEVHAVYLNIPELEEDDCLDYYVCYHKTENKKHIRRFVTIMHELYQQDDCTPPQAVRKNFTIRYHCNKVSKSSAS